ASPRSARRRGTRAGCGGSTTSPSPSTSTPSATTARRAPRSSRSCASAWPRSRASKRRRSPPSSRSTGRRRASRFTGWRSGVEGHSAVVYLPHNRHIAFARTTLAVRAAGDAAAVTRAVREEIRRMDPALPVFDTRTLAQIVDRELGFQRRLAAVVAGFGAVALLLATLGLYGVVAYTVAARTREIGVQIALGAGTGEVVGLFVRDGMRLAAIGPGIGGALALALGHVVASIVFGIEPLDPAAALGTAATLAAATLVASAIPARRAARVEPMVVLRGE